MVSKNSGQLYDSRATTSPPPTPRAANPPARPAARAVWVGVLCANPEGQERPVFCAGADLKVIASSGDPSTLETERGGFAGYVFRERTKPIVAAVDGLATAGGCEIVLASDIVVA